MTKTEIKKGCVERMFAKMNADLALNESQKLKAERNRIFSLSGTISRQLEAQHRTFTSNFNSSF